MPAFDTSRVEVSIVKKAIRRKGINEGAVKKGRASFVTNCPLMVSRRGFYRQFCRFNYVSITLLPVDGYHLSPIVVLHLAARRGKEKITTLFFMYSCTRSCSLKCYGALKVYDNHTDRHRMLINFYRVRIN